VSALLWFKLEVLPTFCFVANLHFNLLFNLEKTNVGKQSLLGFTQVFLKTKRKNLNSWFFVHP